jgi:hypothetical protein
MMTPAICSQSGAWERGGISLFIGGVVIRMKGNKTQIIAVNGDYGPERTCDSYRIEGVAFPSLHVPDFLQVEPWGTSNLVEVHLRQGAESLD